MDDFEPILKLIWESEESDRQDSANTPASGTGTAKAQRNATKKGDMKTHG